MSETTSRRTALRLIIAATLASTALGGLGAAHAASGEYDPAPYAEVDGLKAKFIDVAGQRTRYYEYGQGEPLLLIHGGGRGTTSSANNFSPVIPLLAKHYRVIAFDKSAAGMTDNPKDDNDLSYQGEVKHTYNLIQHAAARRRAHRRPFIRRRRRLLSRHRAPGGGQDADDRRARAGDAAARKVDQARRSREGAVQGFAGDLRGARVPLAAARTHAEDLG